LEQFVNKLFGKPSTSDVGLYYNPVLHVAATVITWSTILLAVYDILGPFLTSIATNTSTEPLIISAMKLAMGFGLSVAGVFFVQAASHEIGVRILTDQPARLADVLDTKLAEHTAQEAELLRQYDQRQAEHTSRVQDTRQNVRRRFVQAKLAERERRKQESQQPAPFMFPVPQKNGNGHTHP
jgi:cytochrome c biogenesis factor